jgi:drug/metabolite transporter (DMT)-like permease
MVDTGPVFAPLVVARTAAVCGGLILFVVLRPRPPGLHRPDVACLAGFLDAGGNALYLLATRYARLDVAAVLSSLYPAATVALSSWLLTQHVTRTQWLGVLLCLVAVMLMSL